MRRHVGDGVTVIRCNSVDLWLDDGLLDGWMEHDYDFGVSFDTVL